jgi:archaeal flagellar protein FlaJ
MPRRKSDNNPLLEPLVEYFKTKFPNLRKKLKMAKMDVSEDGYINTTLIMTFLTSILVLILGIMLLYTSGMDLFVIIPLFLLTLIFSFLFFMKRVDVEMSKRELEIDKELLFAGKQLLIEIRGGIPLFDAVTHLTEEYGEASNVFKEIVNKTNLGVPLDVALEDVSEETPSKPFKRLALQIVNSIRSGSDVAVALEAILDQLAQEQIIQIKEYSQKLNPLGMFYLLFGIILPSMGITLAVTLLTFTGVSFGPSMLWGMLIVIGITQYIFLTMIQSSRPRFEI